MYQVHSFIFMKENTLSRLLNQVLTYLKKIKLQTVAKRFLADTTTPVSIYLKVRDHFESSLLLESTDFRSAENCFSFICMEPIASFEVTEKRIETKTKRSAKAAKRN